LDAEGGAGGRGASYAGACEGEGDGNVLDTVVSEAANDEVWVCAGPSVAVGEGGGRGEDGVAVVVLVVADVTGSE
jgi:hypothetical protein